MKKKDAMAGAFLSTLRAPEPDAAPAEPASQTPAESYDAFLELRDIQAHPYNREVDVDGEDAAALRESILANGFTDKVQVLTREHAEALGVEGLGPEPYVALNCHHRLEICRKYRPDVVTAECVVRYFASRLDMLYTLSDYNASRPLKMSDRAKQIRLMKPEVQQTLRQGEDTYERIAARLGKSRTLIYMLDSISAMEPELLALTDEGLLTLRQTSALRKLPPENQRALALALRACGEGKGPEEAAAARRKLLANPEELPREQPERAKVPELRKVLAGMERQLPAPDAPITVPKYRRSVLAAADSMDALLVRLADYRLRICPELALSPAAEKALRELIEGLPK